MWTEKEIADTVREVAEDYDIQPLVTFISDTISNLPPRRRFIVVGQRRFLPEAAAPFRKDWTWDTMLSYPAITETHTPTAHERLRQVGLRDGNAYFVDLLPPGPGWDEEAERQAVVNATYLRGVADALDCIIIVAAVKAHIAFVAADPCLHGQGLLELRHGVVPIPSPHVIAKDSWWTRQEKLDDLADLIQDLVNGMWRADD